MWLSFHLQKYNFAKHIFAETNNTGCYANTREYFNQQVDQPTSAMCSLLSKAQTARKTSQQFFSLDLFQDRQDLLVAGLGVDLVGAAFVEGPVGWDVFDGRHQREVVRLTGVAGSELLTDHLLQQQHVFCIFAKGIKRIRRSWPLMWRFRCEGFSCRSVSFGKLDYMKPHSSEVSNHRQAKPFMPCRRLKALKKGSIHHNCATRGLGLKNQGEGSLVLTRDSWERRLEKSPNVKSPELLTLHLS